MVFLLEFQQLYLVRSFIGSSFILKKHVGLFLFHGGKSDALFAQESKRCRNHFYYVLEHICYPDVVVFSISRLEDWVLVNWLTKTCLRSSPFDPPSFTSSRAESKTHENEIEDEVTYRMEDVIFCGILSYPIESSRPPNVNIMFCSRSFIGGLRLLLIHKGGLFFNISQWSIGP